MDADGKRDHLITGSVNRNIAIVATNLSLLFILLLVVELVMRGRRSEEEFSPWVVDAALSYYEMFALRPGRADGVTVERIQGVTTKRVNPSNPETGKLVYMFGGSTTVGGARDDETIAAHLASIATEEKVPLIVENFGVGNFRSTEEVMKLTKLLRAGFRPDLVLFYDGFNDTEFAANGDVRFGMLEPMDDVFRKDVTVHDVEKVLSGIHLYKAFSAIPRLQGVIRGTACRAVGVKRDVAIEPIDTLDLSNFEKARRHCADTYASNVFMVEALADAYRFRPVFVLQPMIYFKQPLTRVEQDRFDAVAPHLVDRVPVLYADIRERMKGDENFYDLSMLFDGVTNTVFSIDQGHLQSDGRRAVAEGLFEILSPLVRTSSTEDVESVGL